MQRRSRRCAFSSQLSVANQTDLQGFQHTDLLSLRETPYADISKLFRSWLQFQPEQQPV